MAADDLGALVLFAGANIRYATASYQGNWKYNINIRYAVVPATGAPTLFETAGSDMQCAIIDLPWMAGRIRPAITWQWAEGAVPFMAGRMAESVMDVLKEHGVEKGKIGIDNLDMPAFEAFKALGLHIVNGWPAVSRARVVKTRDEIELLKQASSIGDAAMWKIKYEWLKPGVREREIEAKVHEFMLERGCEIIYDIIVASGGNTSPYRRWATDKLIRQGDLVIVDINAVGPSGYFIDFVRCFKCAGPYGVKMTGKEIDLYREVYDSMYAGIEQLRVGNTSADVAKVFPEYDDDKYGTVTLQQFAHSIGITLYEGMWMSRAYSMKYPAEIKEAHVFRDRDVRGAPGAAADVPPGRERARDGGRAGDLHAHGAHGRGDGALVSRTRSSVTIVRSAAPDWQGVTTENIGSMRGRSNAVRRDAPPGMCQRTSGPGH